MEVTVTDTLKFKNGKVWEKGKLIHIFPHEENPTFIIVNDGISQFITTSQLLKYFNEIQWPTLENLSEWLLKDVYETITGEIVEPDGRDSEGWPPWTTLLGYI